MAASTANLCEPVTQPASLPKFTHLRIDNRSSQPNAVSQSCGYGPPSEATASEPNLSLNISTIVSSPRTESPSRSDSRYLALKMPTAHPMQRAHSSPSVDSSGKFIAPPTIHRRPVSPLNQHGRRRSPMRAGMDDSYPSALARSGLSIEPDIPENEQLDTYTTNHHLATVSEIN